MSRAKVEGLVFPGAKDSRNCPKTGLKNAVIVAQPGSRENIDCGLKEME